jgi:hypothetical protein
MVIGRKKKGEENFFLRGIAYILLIIVIFQGCCGRISWGIVKKHSVIVKIYKNKTHVKMSCKLTFGKDVGKS